MKARKTEPKPGDEFASAMQQLSAEAERIQPVNGSSEDASEGQLSQILEAVRGLSDRMQKLETLVAAPSPASGLDLAEQFQKMDAHLSALRSTDAVNQRLFDSLHDELIKYRDNFLHESLQKPFIRDLVNLYDDLSGLSAQLENAAGGAEAKRGKLSQWHDNLENAVHSLTEILHRMEVSEIEPKEMVDRACHRVVSFEPADFAEDDGRIVMRIKRGFLWRDQVLRPEEVVAKRFE